MDTTQIASIVKESVAAAVSGPLAALGDRLTRLENAPATANAAAIIEAARAGRIRAADTSKSRYSALREQMRKDDAHGGLGFDFVAAFRSMAFARINAVSPALAASRFGYEAVAERLSEVAGIQQKALAEGTLADGGWLIPPEYSDEVIELLRATSIFRGLGPRMLDMPRGSLTIPKQTAGGSAAYVGESAKITKSQQTGGTITLSSKKLAALTPFSNDWLRDSSPRGDRMVRDDLVAVIGLKEDLEFFRGTGASGGPKGLLNHAPAANKFNATQAGSNATLEEVDKDLHTLMGKVEDSDVKLDDTCAWAGHPRTFRYLSQLRDGVGGYVFRDEIQSGMLLGYKIGKTSQIPKNLGSGTNESELYFAKMSDVLLADNLDLEVTFHPDATYDDAGTIVSGVTQDQSLIRAISKHDLGVRHAESVAVMQVVKWGA